MVDEAQTEKQLIASVLAGDESAFNLFFESYFDRLFRFVTKRVDQDEDLAKDVVQQTMTTAMQQLDKFRGEASLFTWLAFIARSKISLHFRRLENQPRRVVRRESSPAVQLEVDQLEDNAKDSEKQISDAERSQMVHGILDGLPGRYGEILVWKYIESIPVTEIAGRLETTFEAAQSSLARARVAFKKAVHDSEIGSELLIFSE